ncbi:MAG: hypothetical protein VCD50_10825 [Alphaproteobacteria bacterium]
MEVLFTSEYRYLWMALLAAALFIPVRQLIWVLSVRRAIGKAGEEAIDDAERHRLKKRASVTSALLCSLFSLVYINVLFST